MDHAHVGKTDLNKRGSIISFTGFMLACLNGHKNVVNIMLEHPSTKYIDKNMKDRQGRTAFRLACMDDRLDVLLLLMIHSKDKTVNHMII